MGTAILFVLGIFVLIAIGLLTVGFKARNTWRRYFPSKVNRAKLRILDQGLETAGFYGTHDDPDTVKVIDNEFLSTLISELHETEDLDLYVENKKLRISNNNNRKLDYGWVLASEFYAIGFNIKR